jgi:hypothetical protein
MHVRWREIVIYRKMVDHMTMTDLIAVEVTESVPATPRTGRSSRDLASSTPFMIFQQHRIFVSVRPLQAISFVPNATLVIT